MYQHRLTTLKNGLRLVTIPMPQVESLTVLIGVAAGSRYETKKVNGLFHFIEHMAFKGTKARPTTLAIASEIEGIGGEFNAYTSQEFTYYYLKLASKHADLAFEILSDMVMNSLFKAEEIEREKGVIIEEINMYNDTPVRRVWEVFLRLLYGDNPMGWDVAGEPETVKNLERHDFIKFINQLYYPKNMVLGVAGKIEEKKIHQLAQDTFGKLERGGQKVSKNIRIIQDKPRVDLFFKKTEQAHFILGMPSFSLFHKDRFVLAVLATILGGGMSSRLFIQVRERRGLAYYVGSDADFFTDSGFVASRGGVKLDKVDEAIKVTIEEMGKLASHKVFPKELTKAKEMIKGQMILGLEDSLFVAERYTSQLSLEKKIRTPAQTFALLDKVTTEDVLRVAKTLFKPQKLNLAVIGPYKNETKFRKLLR